jgi:hypothetical protein
MQPPTELSMIALAHLSMIAQAANGEYKPQPGEIERRQAWLTEYLMTGQGIVTDESKLSAQKVNAALKAEHSAGEAIQ